MSETPKELVPVGGVITFSDEMRALFLNDLQPENWFRQGHGPGPERDEALRRLRAGEDVLAITFPYRTLSADDVDWETQ